MPPDSELRTRGRGERLRFAPARRCWACDAPIDPHQAIEHAGVCTRIECRIARRRQAGVEDRRIESERRERALRRLHEHGVDPETESWSLTPANPAVTVPLLPELRRDFLRHLDRTVEESLADGVWQRSPREGRRERPLACPAPGPEESRALAVGCAACRGWCCRQGGTHAFLDRHTIERVRRDRPDFSPEDVTRHYASYLGTEHMEGGCVFQSETGCRLPREMRSDACNRHLCEDLLAVLGRWRSSTSRTDATHRFVAIQLGDKTAPAVRETQLPTNTAPRIDG